MKFNKNLTSVSTSLLILKLLKEQDMYGYQIISELSCRSNNIFEFKEGTLYPFLHSLEKDKLIESYMVTSNSNRQRKYYRITALGKEQYTQNKDEWSVFSKSINTILAKSEA